MNETDAELNERYLDGIEILAGVEDPETQRQVLNLIENGFAPFSWETIATHRAEGE